MGFSVKNPITIKEIMMDPEKEIQAPAEPVIEAPAEVAPAEEAVDPSKGGCIKAY